MRRAFTGRRLLIAITVAVTLIALVSAFRDLPAVGRALRGFEWRLLPAVLVLSTVMHLLRFARWHLYAGRVAGPGLGVRDSLVIYGAGLGTHLTPGRVGEVVRFAYLRRVTGTPVSRSAPIIVAERITDGLALFGLALPAALLLGLGGRGAVALVLIPVVTLAILASHRAHQLFLGAAGRMPLIRRYVALLTDSGAELRALFAARILAPAACLSLAAVALEVGAFTTVLAGVGVPVDARTYLRAAFILPSAMLGSALFVVPGSVGVAEGGLAALTRALLAASAASAAAAAVLVRLCTLWLGLAAGALGLVVATHRWGRRPAGERAVMGAGHGSRVIGDGGQGSVGDS